MQTHSRVSVNMWVVSKCIMFLSCYYETSFVIFLNLMICGGLLGLPCKQIMSKYDCFKKLEITRFQRFF